MDRLKPQLIISMHFLQYSQALGPVKSLCHTNADI